MQPTIHQADVNGRSIYRVRVGGMSKADAVALCVKLKAAAATARASSPRTEPALSLEFARTITGEGS